MNQLTFSDMEYSNRKKKTKREEFLDAMEEIIPWSYWVEMIRPYYFANKRGRKPIGIETMLRMYLMQIWFNLSDEGIEDSIYDSYAMRSFMHIDFNEQQVPDATTLLKFRHMLEANKLGEKIFADVNILLVSKNQLSPISFRNFFKSKSEKSSVISSGAVRFTVRIVSIFFPFASG